LGFEEVVWAGHRAPSKREDGKGREVRGGKSRDDQLLLGRYDTDWRGKKGAVPFDKDLPTIDAIQLEHPGRLGLARRTRTVFTADDDRAVYRPTGELLERFVDDELQ
jgi:hypothetical protein